jgi:hypothetical protein
MADKNFLSAYPSGHLLAIHECWLRCGAQLVIRERPFTDAQTDDCSWHSRTKYVPERIPLVILIRIFAGLLLVHFGPLRIQAYHWHAFFQSDRSFGACGKYLAFTVLMLLRMEISAGDP